jgi:hypothetical protein
MCCLDGNTGSSSGYSSSSSSSGSSGDYYGEGENGSGSGAGSSGSSEGGIPESSSNDWHHEYSMVSDSESSHGFELSGSDDDDDQNSGSSCADKSLHIVLRTSYDCYPVELAITNQLGPRSLAGPSEANCTEMSVTGHNGKPQRFLNVTLTFASTDAAEKAMDALISVSAPQPPYACAFIAATGVDLQMTVLV